MFAPLSLMKFQMYVSMTKQNTWNTWSQSLGGSDPTDEEQDTLKVQRWCVCVCACEVWVCMQGMRCGVCDWIVIFGL